MNAGPTITMIALSLGATVARAENGSSVVASAPKPPNPLVPRNHSSEEVDRSTVADTTRILLPGKSETEACGLQGTIDERTDDCLKKVSYAEPREQQGKNIVAWWSLVSRDTSGNEVWRDNLTGLIWSDNIVRDSTESGSTFNWCHASGASAKVGSPFSYPLSKHCSNRAWQNQNNPISLCAEDSTFLAGIVTSSPAKGKLGKRDGATTPFTWWLPAARDFQRAYVHGASRILPGFRTRYWTRSQHVLAHDFAYFFHGERGTLGEAERDGNFAVRCVGVAE